MEKEIVCLCPHCKKEILMRFFVNYLGISVKELKTIKKEKKWKKNNN